MESEAVAALETAQEAEAGLQPRQRRRNGFAQANGSSSSSSSSSSLSSSSSSSMEEEKGGEKSVYFDPVQGVWKCQHCSWTYPLSGSGIRHLQSHEELCQFLMDVKMLLQHRSNFHSRSEGVKSPDDLSFTNLNKMDHFIGEHCNRELVLPHNKTEIIIKPRNGVEAIPAEGKGHDSDNIKAENGSEPLLSSEINIKEFPENIKMGNGSNSLFPLEESSLSGITGIGLGNEVQEQVILVKKGKMEVAEYDVERVLEEQETHDLFCPNCKSCITRRVILRKRKRSLPAIQDDPKRGRTEEIYHNPDSTSGLTETNEQDQERKPDVFRCFSCFNIFSRDSEFDICGIFRKRGNLNQNSPAQVAVRSINWYSYIIGSLNSKKKGSKKGDFKHHIFSGGSEFGENKENDKNILSTSVPEIIVQQGQADPREIMDVEKGDNSGVSAPGESYFSSGERTEDVAPKDKQKGQITNVVEALIRGNGQTYIGEKLNDAIGNNGAADIVKLVEEGSSGSITQVITDQKVISEIVEDIHVPKAPEAAISPVPDIRISVPFASEGRPRGWDVLKSIVYGGLTESITSLGVISSAAGAEATTLHILALGLANLVSGFFVIAHNLSELRSSQRDAIDEEVEPSGRYWELLGRRQNFRLHAFVVVLSYIIFGLVPPVVYGFSFRKSDDKEYKLIAVAAASLFCIALLAIGKAHVTSQRAYIKTLSYYIALGVSASSLTYACGVLTNRLLEKLGLFDESAAVAPSPPAIALLGRSSTVATWASY